MSPGCASRSQWTITRFPRPANTRAGGLSAAGPMSTWTCSPLETRPSSMAARPRTASKLRSASGERVPPISPATM